MTRRIFQFAKGETFAEPADWHAFTRDALFDKADYPYFDIDMRDGYGGPDRRLYDLYNALRGTGAETALADGVLRVMETGTPQERFRSRLGPYEFAPNVIARLALLLERDREVLIEAHLLGHVIGRLFELKDGPELGRKYLRVELQREDSPDLGLIACQRDLGFFAEHMPPYKPTYEPAAWLYFEEGERLTMLLETMASRPGYSERLRADLRSPKLTDDERSTLRRQLLSHPIAKSWVD